MRGLSSLFGYWLPKGHTSPHGLLWWKGMYDWLTFVISGPVLSDPSDCLSHKLGWLVCTANSLRLHLERLTRFHQAFPAGVLGTRRQPGADTILEWHPLPSNHEEAVCHQAKVRAEVSLLEEILANCPLFWLHRHSRVEICHPNPKGLRKEGQDVTLAIFITMSWTPWFQCLSCGNLTPYSQKDEKEFPSKMF